LRQNKLPRIIKLEEIIYNLKGYNIREWNKQFKEIMTNDMYKLNLWKSFKTHDVRDIVIKFVIKTLDKIAHPLLAGETINKQLFKVK